tara:strand:+ start:5404 stop:5715 length:312 start_codon:yes stop_codon:yes gene_type:complete
MMEFFTALIIYYSVNGLPDRSVIWFESFSQCEQALRVDDFFDKIYSDASHMHVACKKTNTLSKSIKPKSRPEVIDGKEVDNRREEAGLHRALDSNKRGKSDNT